MGLENSSSSVHSSSLSLSVSSPPPQPENGLDGPDTPVHLVRFCSRLVIVLLLVVTALLALFLAAAVFGVVPQLLQVKQQLQVGLHQLLAGIPQLGWQTLRGHCKEGGES